MLSKPHVYVDRDRARIGPFPEYLFTEGREAKKAIKEASEGLILILSCSEHCLTASPIAVSEKMSDFISAPEKKNSR